MMPLLGIGLGLFALYASIVLEEMNITAYFNWIAIILVFGVTLCVLLIVHPLKDVFKMLINTPKLMFKDESQDSLRDLIVQYVKFSEVLRQGLTALENEAKLSNEFLVRQGISLLVDGFTFDEIEEIMYERANNPNTIYNKLSDQFKQLAKYPPSFGMIGTVLGLIAMMVSVSQSAKAGEVGSKMAIALVATFYGLVISNLILLPLSENSHRKQKHLQIKNDIILQGTLLLKKEVTPLKMKEVLASFLPDEIRNKFLEGK